MLSMGPVLISSSHHLEERDGTPLMVRAVRGSKVKGIGLMPNLFERRRRRDWGVEDIVKVVVMGIRL